MTYTEIHFPCIIDKIHLNLNNLKSKTLTDGKFNYCTGSYIMNKAQFENQLLHRESAATR